MNLAMPASSRKMKIQERYDNIVEFKCKHKILIKKNVSFFCQGYHVEIYDLNGQSLEKLRNAIAFSYDRVNARVAVTALFPEPICIRAVISYLEQKLPNGDFDIIVLSSKFPKRIFEYEYGMLGAVYLMVF